MRPSDWLAERGDATWLAHELGVSVQTIWRWKSGKVVPRSKYIAKIAKLSKGAVTVADFYPDAIRRGVGR